MKRLLICGLLLAQGIFAQGNKWVPTWAMAQQAPRSFGPARAGTFTGSFSNQTARMVLRTSVAGSKVRVTFSNLYGTKPLEIGTAHIALQSKDSAINAGSDHALMFNGKPGVWIPPGASMITDPVDMQVSKLADLAISVFIPGETGPATQHSNASHTTYIKTGDQTAAADLADATYKTASYYFLESVEVQSAGNVPVLVAFGDSITDGTRSTVDANAAWPSVMAARLNNIAVINEGIAANRVLQNGFGDSALARLDRDVLAFPNVKWMTLLEGTNDLGAGIGPEFVFAPRPNPPANEVVTADQLIGAYKQIIERAHEHGIKVYGSTIMPFEGAAYYTEHGNETRMTVNQWIRSAKAFDQTIDFDALMKDPASPNKIKAAFDSGDHLHPNDAGYKAMAESLNMAWFK